MDAILVASIGFLAAIAGGLLQAWTSRRGELARFREGNRNAAYLSFCSGIGQLSFTNDFDDEHRAALAAVAEARFKVALYGSPAVIDAMIRVVDHPNVRSPQAQSDIGTMIEAMRRDCLPDENTVSQRQLYILTYGDPTKDKK